MENFSKLYKTNDLHFLTLSTYSEIHGFEIINLYFGKEICWPIVAIKFIRALMH